MTTNISKIRDEKLTEDEKMEIIADYLENGGGGGGGGGGSDKLRVKVNVDYVPTSKYELDYVEGEGVGVYNALAPYVTVQDEEGNPVDISVLKENIANGTIEIIGMDHFGDQVSIDGDNVTVTPGGVQLSSIPTGTMFMNDFAYMAVGQIQGTGMSGLLTAALAITGDDIGALVGVVIQ